MLGSGEEEAVIVGGVLSMLTVAEAVAIFPAKSVASPLTFCSAPSVVTITGSVTASTPDRLSEALKVTVTSVLFQPLALGSGEAEAVIVGGVLSMLTVAEAVAALPA